jgi:V-type H+-transporting ATPase subunit a
MTYQLVVMPRESAWEILNELGNLSSLHFVDHDPSLPLINRPFANYIKRCEEVAIKLDMIGKEM